MLLLIKNCVVKHALDKWSHPRLNTRIPWRVFNNSDAQAHPGQFSHNFWGRNHPQYILSPPMLFPTCSQI